MSYTWFKLHHDVISDIKLRRFTAQEKWAWIALLCLASQSDDRGIIHVDDETIADVCEFNSTQDWLYFRDKLIAKGMIEMTGIRQIAVVHWEKRQHKYPSNSTEATRKRKQEQRQREKEAIESREMSRHVTSESRACHDTDTDKELELEISREEKDLSCTLASASSTNESNSSANSNNSESNPEQELPKEKTAEAERKPQGRAKKSKKTEPNDFTEADFQRFWAINRAKRGIAEARKSFFKVQGISADDLIRKWDEAQLAHIKRKGSMDFFPMAQTWLNQQRWLDELETKPELLKPVPLAVETRATQDDDRQEWVRVAKRQGYILGYECDDQGIETIITLTGHRRDFEQCRRKYSIEYMIANPKEVRAHAS